MSSNIEINNIFISDIKTIIAKSREQAIRSVDFQRVQMYWYLGERIVIEEQKGNERAEYGKQILKKLSTVLESEYGSGFSYRQLARARQFYCMFPIVSALRTQFNWSHVKYSLPENNTSILASKYQLYLPTGEQLKKELSL